MSINFIFFGTPDVAKETLEILKSSGYIPSLIVTSPDAPAGRGLKLQSSPVAKFAEENGIPCLKPEKLTGLEADLEAKLPLGSLASKYDVFLVVAYGKIIPEKIINLPRSGSINIHYSLLPKYRGASPVESAILAGEKETGVTIQKMVYKMDAGPILAQEKVAILPDEKAPELRKRLIKIGGEMLVKLLKTPSAFGHSPPPERSRRAGLAGGESKEIPQNETEATYCKKIEKTNGLVDLENEAPEVLFNKFRAYYGWPSIYFFKDSRRIKITDAELKEGQLVINKVLPEGRKEIKYEEFLRNYTSGL